MRTIIFEQGMAQSSPKIKLTGILFRIFIFLLITSPAYLLVNCAKQGSPSGGPKDVRPPDVVEEIPPGRTVHFAENKFTIVFSEFITLKDQAKEIFISPPMKTRPEFKVQGKKLIVEFQEALKPNSTYTINFGKAIVDFTEGSPLVNFEYVFSTGDHIDSLSLHGKILDAFNLKPVEGIVAMVYQDDNDTIPLDSLPLMAPPKSASRSTKDGTYRINNLPAGKFKLFALEDLNNNYIFDLPNERIAFLDTMVTLVSPPEPDFKEADSADSTFVINPEVDSLFIEPPADSVFIEPEADSLFIEPQADSLFQNYTLYLFEESDSTQKFLGKKLISRNLIQYYYRMPVDSFRIDPVGFVPARTDWYVPELSKNRDTISFWLKQGIQDTIRIRVAAGDSLVDTSRYILSAKLQEKPGRRNEQQSKGIIIMPGLTSGALDLNKNFSLKFPVPVVSSDSSRILLYTPTDTLVPRYSFTDTLRHKVEFHYGWKPGEAYYVILDDSAFSDLSVAYNDSLFFRFRVRTPEDYGILILNVKAPDESGQFIIQLLTDKEFLVREKMLEGSGTVRFDYLMPGTFLLKVIFDENANGKWDPGRYSTNTLPEKVSYYSPVLNVRANWELQEEWQIE